MSAANDEMNECLKIKIQNGIKSLEGNKYINTGFIVIAYRFALYGLLKGIILNHILRKTTKLKKATITLQL
jgi:hypothetical protein